MVKIYCILMVMIVCTSLPAAFGCKPAPPPEKPPAATRNLTADVPANKPEPATGTGEKQLEGVPSGLVEPPPNAANEAGEVALNFMAKLGYDRSKLYVIAQSVLYHDGDLWLWTVDIEGKSGPVANAFVRTDLGRIDSFNPNAAYAPMAVKPGEKLAYLTANAIGLKELGFLVEPWLSSPGLTMCRKYVPISGQDVCVGGFLIRFDPENRKLSGCDWRENPPVAEFSMNVDESEAVKATASYLNKPDFSPSHVSLIQIQEVASNVTVMEVYWEVKSEAGYVYVRCKDGRISVNNAGPQEPLGF